jgi:hypothetical protein
MTALVELVAWFFMVGVLIDGARRIVKHAFTGLEDDRMWVRAVSASIIVPLWIGVCWVVLRLVPALVLG